MGDLGRIARGAIPERVQKAMANPPPSQPPDFAMKNLRKVWDAGIPVAMGTDAATSVPCTALRSFVKWR